MKKVIYFCRKEAVLVVALVLAAISAFFVPPSIEYLDYIDWRVLGILLSLMIVMAGLQQNGLFDTLGEALLIRTKSVWQLCLVLVLMCFFFSMGITNDVALITFVPFAMVVLEKSGLQHLLIPVIVLQTVAANLGSMLTPIGNPQNLYLYNLSGMSFKEFILTMLPYSLLSLGMLLLSLFSIKGKNESVAIAARGAGKPDTRKTTVYFLLFVLALLVVLKVLPYQGVLALVLVVVFIMERSVLKKVDYSLLFTFIGFFVFTGNMGRLPVIKETLTQLVEGREIFMGVLSSQVISNVPAALLLSGFTLDYPNLLIGVNIGGLGTLIASMASLISYKIFAGKYNEEKGKYLLWFTVTNIIFLGALLLPACL